MDKMKAVIFTLAVLMGICLFGQQPADFAVRDIRIGLDGFLEILLENLSSYPVPVSKDQEEKTFLTVYIQDERRAEYKLKYMPPGLFFPRGKAIWKTNFRFNHRVRVRTEINLPAVIAETIVENNRLAKILAPHNE